MATLQSALKLTLLDGISAAARNITSALNGVGNAAKGVRGGGFGSSIAAGAEAGTRSVTALHTKLLAVGAAAYGLNRALSGVVNPASGFQTTLLDIAQKADMSDSAMAQLGDRIRGMAKDIGRGAGSVAKGMDVLLGMGLDKDSALGIMPAIGKAAVAYGAEIDDLAKAGMASIDNLKVKVSDFGLALDGMARSGKEGAFEIKEMGRYFPTLAALGSTLKLKGVAGVNEIAAALQVVRKGAGTSEEAATRLGDVFGKLTSDETKKKLAKLGIKDVAADLRKAQIAAEKAGKPFSVIDFTVATLNKALKGDISRIGEIFQDKEARQGAIALLEHYKEFLRIRERGMNAKGEVDQDFARRAKTFEATMARFKGAAEDLAISLGNRILPQLTTVMSAIGDTLNSVDNRVSVFDKFGKAIAGFANGLGFTDIASFGDMLGKLRDSIMGTIASFEADSDRLAQIFTKFQALGAHLRDFASAIASFAGIDTGPLLDVLGTLAGYGAGLAVAAGGLSLLAKGLMGVGRALLFLTGIKAAVGIVKMLGSLAGAIPGASGGVAAAAAGGAGAGAAGAAGVATGGARAAIGRAVPVVGAALIAKEVIDLIGEQISKVREATAKHGLHSQAQSASEGAEKASGYRAEIEEIEGTLDRLREKSRDPETFAFANQAAISRVAELKVALTQIEEQMAQRGTGWSATTAPLPPSRPAELGPSRVEVTGSADVRGETTVNVEVTASSALLSIIEGQKQAIAALSGKVDIASQGASTGVVGKTMRGLHGDRD